MKLKLLLVILLGITLCGFSQRVYDADKLFDGFSYLKAAEIYNIIYEKGNNSKHVLQRLGDCHYNISNTEEAEFFYEALLKKYSDDIEKTYFFKYFQTLKGNGKYKKADSLVVQYKILEQFQNKYEKLRKRPNYLLDYNTSKYEVVIKNIQINTPFSDFGGFSKDSILYYASSKPTKEFKRKRKYRWNNQPFLNLYKAKQVVIGGNHIIKKSVDLEEDKLLPSPITSKYHESNAIITSNGKTMYFTRVNYDRKKLHKDKNKTIHLQIFSAQLIAGKWTNIKELPFNSDEFSTGHPALSSDEKTLYFISDKLGGFGQTDIYKVSVDEGTFGVPENLGETINTKGKEMFPFIGNDETLYFSSDGHLGLGMLDIFEAKETNGTYSEVQNIKAPFNSSQDDFAFFIDKTGKRGFFSSNRKGGKGDDDIYSFVMWDKPCLQTITGIVADKNTQEPISSSIVKLIDATGKIIQELFTDTKGMYRFDSINCTTKYRLFASKENYESGIEEIQTSEKSSETVQTTLLIMPVAVKNEIVINPIYFDYNKYTVRKDAAKELDNIITVLKNNPDLMIKIESHTDARGTKAYNQVLAEKRSTSTRKYFVSRGIHPSRIRSVRGFGEERLVNNCSDTNKNKCTEEDHQLNRRSNIYRIKNTKEILKIRRNKW